MRIMAFIADVQLVHETLGQLNDPMSAPSPAPARDRQPGKLPLPGQTERDTDPQALPAEDDEFDLLRLAGTVATRL